MRNDCIVIDYIGGYRIAACRILDCGFLIVIGTSIQVDAIEYNGFLTAVPIEMQSPIAETCQQGCCTKKISDPFAHHGMS